MIRKITNGEKERKFKQFIHSISYRANKYPGDFDVKVESEYLGEDIMKTRINEPSHLYFVKHKFIKKEIGNKDEKIEFVTGNITLGSEETLEDWIRDTLICLANRLTQMGVRTEIEDSKLMVYSKNGKL